MQNPDPSSLPDLTDAQIQKLLSTAWKRIKKLIEGMDLANEYYGEGGYDREPWNQICDGLSREAMGLMMVLAGPAHPYMARDCERAVQETAGITPREGGMREALQQQVAKGLLMSVLTVGQHHMIEPEEWPDMLPDAVLGAVRRRKASTPTRPWRICAIRASPGSGSRRVAQPRSGHGQFGDPCLSAWCGRVPVVPVCADRIGAGEADGRAGVL